MERFAKIRTVGTRRKLDIKAICRCCGLQNDEKEEILAQQLSDEVIFAEKFSILTGICVSATDKMPQLMCALCIDKINDFYEFRLMAQNTEKQTRDALGLPTYISPVTSRPVIETKPSVVRLTDLKYQTEDSLLIERALRKGNENIPSTSNKRLTPQPAAQPPSKKSRKDISCTICADTHFGYQNDLNDHLMKEHLPLVAKYACGSCRETFEQLSDHKAHESKHTKEKLPYTCFICCSGFLRPREFNKHMTNSNCKRKAKLEVTVEDIKCFQCKKKFLTQNLFEWHGCFLKTRGSCSKCGQYFAKKKPLFKHYVLCEQEFEAPESARDPARHAFKAEGSKMKAPVKVSNAKPKATKGPKKKIVPPRKLSATPNIVKKELNLDPLTGEPVQDDDYSNYEEDITYDNFGNDSDSNDASSKVLEPVVELHVQQPTVRIKQELVNDEPVVQQKSSSSLHPNAITAQFIRNIKKEKGAAPVVSTSKPAIQQQNNMWKMKIKAERGINGKPTAQVLNPMAIRAMKESQAIPKSLKLPQGLAMKIKMEKKDAGYGDVLEERDEAEPEDEDLLSSDQRDQPVVRIKQEKLDPAYGDLSGGKTRKQLINPMALMMRDKPTTNGSLENSLVISAVTSINPVLPSECVDTMSQPSVETSVGTRGTLNNGTGPNKSDKIVMVQIPREFCENQRNHSSTLGPAEEMSGTPESHVNENHLSMPLDTGTEDDLDALLKIYEEASPATDSNELFQELLKFD